MEATRSPQLSRTICILACTAALACSEGPGSAPEPDPVEALASLPELILSNPAAPGSAVTAGSRAALVDAVVYASLPPGSMPDAELARITNLTTGAGATALVVAGGFDPVPIPARADDSLQLRLQLAADKGVRRFYAKVPPRRPPVVVRSDPSPGRRDVPLNARMLLVFSEPISAASLTDSALQLYRDTVRVAGTATFTDSTHLTVAFTPLAPLAAASAYMLRLTRAVQDADGEALGAPRVIEFATSGGTRPSPDTAMAPPPPDTTVTSPPTAGQGVRISVTFSGADTPTEAELSRLAWYASHCEPVSPVDESLADAGCWGAYHSVDGITTQWSLPTGAYVLWLSAMPRNCAPFLQQSATVTAGAMTEVSFEFVCLAIARINVTVDIVGEPPASSVLATCGEPGCSTLVYEIGGGQLVTVEGQHSVTITLPYNCRLDGPGTVTVTALAAEPGLARFRAICDPVFDATLRIVTRTSGMAPAYPFTVSYACWDGDLFDCLGFAIDANATRAVSAPSGSHRIMLNPGPRCVILGPNPVEVVLAAGGLAEAAFDVECQ